MKESQDIFSRIIIGTVLIITGCLIHIGLIFYLKQKPQDIYLLIGVLFFIFSWSIIANLFILVGFKYYFGPGKWFQKNVTNSLKQLAILSIIISIIIVLIFLILLIR